MITMSVANSGATRGCDWFDPKQSWTRSFYVNYDISSLTPSDYFTAWEFRNPASGVSYIGCFAYLDGSDLVQDYEVFTTGSLTSSQQTIINDATDYYLTLRYTASTHLLELLLDGIVKLTATVDLSAFPLPTTDYILNDPGGPIVGASIGYERWHQRALSNTEILAEMASITPVSETMLLSSCPLQTSIDLTDHYHKYLAVFFATGTVTTNTTDPLLSVVAGPPTNTSPAAAIEITSESAYFQNTLTAGAATDVWYFKTADADEYWGAMAYGDSVTYKPTLTVYDGLANANSLTKYLNINPVTPNKCITFPVVSGNTYYFKAARNGAVTPAIAKISLLTALKLTVPAGTVGVSDETIGFGATFLDPTTGYPLHYVMLTDDPVGEGGSILSNGNLIISNDALNGRAVLFDGQLAKIREFSFDSFDSIGSNLTDTFAIVDSSASARSFRLCDATGVLNSTIFGTTSTLIDTIGLNNDASLAYWARSGLSTNQPIHSWVIGTNLAGTDLVAGVVNYNNGRDLIVLQDGSILIPRYKSTATISYIVTRYNAAGSVLSTYDFGTAADLDNRIATAVDDPVNFWIWIKDRTAKIDTFKKVKVSDGSFPVSFTSPEFNAGVYGPAETPTPIRFGHPESCPFWITRVELFGLNNAKSGLYILSGTGGPNAGNPLITHDVDWIDTAAGTSENVKIPDPYYDTYLAGDE